MNSPRSTQVSDSDWHVALVGAGPGDPGLITVRGAELLARADVVLYDGLSNEWLLSHAGDAECICVGKHGRTRIWTQEEIIDRMLRHALEGERVVRLKGGDPAVFARTSEEVDALRSAGIRFEIVPGITAALAAGSYAGIPVTHRELASAVALVTGHERPGKPASAIDWPALARFPGTLVIYMGVTTAGTWTRQLIEGGKPGETPAAIIRRCSLPDQHSVHCRLDEVADHLTPASKMRPPVITIVGEVTRLAETMSWFDRRPLFGQTVLVTRPEGIDGELTRRLRDAGSDVIHSSAIRIEPSDAPELIDSAIADINRFDTIVFCSRNGVHHFLNRMLQNHDVRKLAGLRIAAVGEKTAEAIAEYHLWADLVPREHRGDGLADELIRDGGRACLVIRASRGGDQWIDRLRSADVSVHQVVAYQNIDVACWDDSVLDEVRNGRVDWLTLTSSATARNVARLLGTDMRRMRIATLSPVTSQAVRSLGYEVAAEADDTTMESLVEAMIISQTIDRSDSNQSATQDKR